MKRYFVFVLFFILSVQSFGQYNYSPSQIELDLFEHHNEVYFCFTKETYNPSFAISDLSSFQKHLKEYSKLNYIFHLENHDKPWQELAKTRHGIRYAIVCNLRMFFGIEGSLTLYYQNPLRDLQWEQIGIYNHTITEPNEWISNLALNLVNKLIDGMKKDERFEEFRRELLKYLKERDTAQNGKISGLEQKLEDQFTILHNSLEQFKKDSEEKNKALLTIIDQLSNKLVQVKTENANLNEKNNHLDNKIDELEKKISKSSALFTSINEITIGKITSIQPRTTLSYEIPSSIPQEATEILVHFWVVTGQVSGSGRTYFDIYTKKGSTKFSSRVSIFLNGNRAMCYNSDSFWLPITSSRTISVYHDGNWQQSPNFDAEVSILGYK